MDYIEITSKDVAKSIAADIEEATGTHCEAFTNEAGSIVLYDHTTVIARVTAELFPYIVVNPLYGSFAGETTSIPVAVRTFDDMKEAASAMDIATSYTLNAALNH